MTDYSVTVGGDNKEAERWLDRPREHASNGGYVMAAAIALVVVAGAVT